MGRSPSPFIEENKAFVRGLTDDCDEGMITKLFENYGRVTEVFIARDHETKTSRGFAFVTFDSNKDCEDACKGLNGKEFRGKPLHVERSAKPRGGSRGFRGGARGRSGYQSRGGRSPPSHSSRDYEYRSRPSGGRDDRSFSRGSRRPYPPRGGRGRGMSPPSREYDYHSRSSPVPAPRSDKYYAEVVGGRDSRYYRDSFDMYPKAVGEYPRSRYEAVEYRSTRPRHDYSPPMSRREYEPVSRSYAPMPPREYYDYAPTNGGRYSPGPPPRREYEAPSRAYEISRHDGYAYRSAETSRGYAGSYSSRMNSGYAKASPPPRPVPRDYSHSNSGVRDGGPIRRPAPVRSVSPPPKRIKHAAEAYERRGASPPQRVQTSSSRRF